MRKTPFLLFLLFPLPAGLFADEVFLKGAGSLSGRVVEQTGTMVTVDLGGGTVGVSMSHVDHITKGPTDLDEYDRRVGRLGPQDLDGWRELARWASQHRMEGQASRAYGMVLALEPDDREARGALGFALLDGRWVTQEVAYRTRGFVRYEGEWMLPDEARIRQEDAAAGQAARDAERSARKAELDQLKAEVQAAYAAEAAADAEWRAEGAAWFYCHAYGWYGCCDRGYGGYGGYIDCGITTWGPAPDFNRHTRRSR